MNPQDVSLIPPHFTSKPSRRFDSRFRLWQSAPSAVQTPGGRIFVVYSGDNNLPDEECTNYSICACSDDGGQTYRPVFYAWHDHEVRMSETLLFWGPDGFVYHFWTQSYGYFDGRGGIWCAKCKDPDAPNPKFGRPRRICDGFMANNPVILKDGRWMFPASVWTHIQTHFHPLPDYERPSVWVGSGCNALRYLGGTYDPDPDYTENTVYETKDEKLIMLLRTRTGIAESESSDGGHTWSGIRPYVLPGPASRFCVMRYPSGALLIINHYEFSGRNNLTALLSYDDGVTFPYHLLLDSRDHVSYPSGNITSDGRAVIAYDRERTGAREILLASFTEEDIRSGTLGPDSFTQRIVSIGGEKGYV